MSSSTDVTPPVSEALGESLRTSPRRLSLVAVTKLPGWIVYHSHRLPARFCLTLATPAKRILAHLFPSPQVRVARLFRRARGLIAEGKQRRAIACFDRINAIDPTNRLAFADRAALRLLRGESWAAEHDFRRALYLLDLAPDHPEKQSERSLLFEGLIHALLRQGKYPEAMRVAARGDTGGEANHAREVRSMLGVRESVPREHENRFAGS